MTIGAYELNPATSISNKMRLTAVGKPFRNWNYKNTKNRLSIVCRCECGQSTVCRFSHWKEGNIKSCGCLNKSRGRKSITHRREYTSWANMMQRCDDKTGNPIYADYSGRGISVCDRWRASFDNFIADMGPRPSKLHSIDRIDNNGNYEPGNCRWATRIQQSRNKRTSRFLDAFGKSQTLSEWAEETGLSIKRIWSRLNRGWSAEKALSRKVNVGASQ